jgi:hypothetical protein
MLLLSRSRMREPEKRQFKVVLEAHVQRYLIEIPALWPIGNDMRNLGESRSATAGEWLVSESLVQGSLGYLL